MLLVSIAIAAIAGPIGIGVLHPSVVKADEAQRFTALRFDSATLTPAQADGSRLFLMQHGQFTFKNVTLKTLIATAYGVPSDRIVGGPDWIGTQHYDFEARWTTPAGGPLKTPEPDKLQAESRFFATTTVSGAPEHDPEVDAMPPPAPVQAMLRNFLAEHVSLKIRDDSAVMPVYELIIANGGSKLTPNPAPRVVPAESPMEMKTRVEAINHNGQQSLAMINGDPRLLCVTLSRQLGREVVDKTGLTGRYDFEIALSSPADPDQLAASLRDRYGLDLQQSQQPVRTLAVDNVELPQAN